MKTKGKSKIEELRKNLEFNSKHIKKMEGKDIEADACKYCKDYMKFLNNCKTEKECVKYIKKLAIENGYKKFNKNANYKFGDKVYFDIKNRTIILSTIGKNSLSYGASIVASHIDSPRLDLKSKPLFSDNELAMFKTHYYGGIKKYQWVTIPLALHGMVFNKNGEKVEICIGEKEEDTVFYISDLLPHLSKRYDNNRYFEDLIAGEQLNALIGSMPLQEENLDGDVKLNILKILNEKYNITEADFISADLSLVPAFKAKTIGLDKSLIGAYGQDDRVCVYASLMAEIKSKGNEFTTITVFADREEIGSEGNTGLASDILKNYILTLCNLDLNSYLDCIENSICLSTDVKPAFDPTWSYAYEKNNCSYLNYGICLTKYTGYGGKAGTSEASAELISKIRNLLDKNQISWQISLNKIDQGGGGTIAKFIAALGIDVIDIGVPILSMHSPYEVVSKLDTYMMFKTLNVFLSRNKL